MIGSPKQPHTSSTVVDLSVRNSRTASAENLRKRSRPSDSISEQLPPPARAAFHRSEQPLLHIPTFHVSPDSPTGARYPGARYQKQPVLSAQSVTESPNGSKILKFDDGAKTVRITDNSIGGGGQVSVHAATIQTPSGTVYPMAAIEGLSAPNTIQGTVLFPKTTCIRVESGELYSLMPQGMSLEKVVDAIRDYDEPQLYKYAFLVSHLPTILEQLDVIRETGNAHQDVKPENIIVFPNRTATLTDYRNLPAIGATRFGSTHGFRSPGRHIKRANWTSDVYAIGQTLKKELFTSDYLTQLPTGMDGLILKTEKPSSERPKLLDVKTEIEQILTDFRAINPDRYDQNIAAISQRFYEFLEQHIAQSSITPPHT